jgi:tight adherence protein C
VSWIVAAAYVAAGWMLLSAMATRADPRVMRSLAVSRGATGPSRSRSEVITRRLRLRRSRENLTGLVARTGLPAEAVERAIGLKVLLGAVGTLAGMSAGAPLGLLASPLLAVSGYRLPEFILARRAVRVRARGEARVPDLLDVVAVCVTAGLTPRLALDRAAVSVGEPLGSELLRARREVGLGGSWRKALMGVADRTGLEEVRRLGSVLERSDRLGTPVVDPLRELARAVRAERRAGEEERARRAPVTMLFPLVFLILPAFVLAALVPAVLVATRGVA